MCGHGMLYFGGQERCVKFPCSTKCFPWDVTKAGNGKMKDGNKTENWKMKLLIGLGFKVGFVFQFFIFPFPMLFPAVGSQF